MSKRDTKAHKNPTKRWALIIGIFVLVQMIFFAIDETFLEPNINDSGLLYARIIRKILGSALFTEWITPYSYPFFNFAMTVHVIAILLQAGVDIFARIFSANNSKGAPPQCK